MFDNFDADNSGQMSEEECKIFYNRVAKRWKMLNLAEGDEGYKQFIKEARKYNSTNQLWDSEFVNWLLTKS